MYCIFSKPIGAICSRHDLSYHCYADDTQLYFVIKPQNNWSNVARRIEPCLSDISMWMKTNMLKLNQDKTEMIVFSPKHRLNEFRDCQLNFDGCIVSDASFIKNLGVHFDKALTMEKHISVLVKSCYSQIRNIGRIRPYLSESACKTLVATLVTSRLDYGNALFHGVNSNVLSKLQKVQNTAARLITRTKKYDHITPSLMDLHWLPVQYRCQYKLLLYTFKILTGRAPAYLQDLLTLYIPSRRLRSENSMLLSQPRVRTKTFGDRRFDKAASTLWNSLPSNIRHEQSVEIFKKQLKTYLFRLAYADFI